VVTFLSLPGTSAGLRRTHRNKRLTCADSIQYLLDPVLEDEKRFSAFLRTLFRQYWGVYAKPAFGGPEQVIRYLGRYTHRVAISNHRLVSFEDDQVTFRWRDYAHGNKQRLMTVSTKEFTRRFLLHVLPKGFVRIEIHRLGDGRSSCLCSVYDRPNPRGLL